jgi:hypothetical protein
MSRFLILYKVNSAVQPADPKIALKLTEASMAAHNELVKAGIIKESGALNPGEGYMITEANSFEEAYKLTNRFWPNIIADIREIIPWEKNEEIVLSSLREQAK